MPPVRSPPHTLRVWLYLGHLGLEAQPGLHRKHLCSYPARAHFFFFCFLVLYFLIHPFLSIDSLTVSSETFWSPHRSPSIFISKHPNFFLGPPHPQAACREGSALRGPWVGQEAAGRWAASREVRLLTRTPERPLKKEGAAVSLSS